MQKSLRTAGYYYLKSKPRQKRRFFCEICNRTLSFRYQGIKGWDARIFKEVKKLINKKRLTYNKYDPRKSLYLSGREIESIIQKRFKRNTPHNTISYLIKKYRIEKEKPYRWTLWELNALFYLRKEGKTYREISKELNRTKYACERTYRTYKGRSEEDKKHI